MVGLAPVRRRGRRVRQYHRGARGHLLADLPQQEVLQHGVDGLKRPRRLRPRRGQPLQHLRHLQLRQLGAERQAHRVQRRARGAPRGHDRGRGHAVVGHPFCRLQLALQGGGQHAEPLHAPLWGGVEPGRGAELQLHGQQRDHDDCQPPPRREVHPAGHILHRPHPPREERRRQRVPPRLLSRGRGRRGPLGVDLPLDRDHVGGDPRHIRGIHHLPPQRGSRRRRHHDHRGPRADLHLGPPLAGRGRVQQQRGARDPHRAQRRLAGLVHHPVG
mmetsp:Transcript_38841/g.90579  ORF Transcript_38841/g.90579 Transcript_38841/m.90579 type:complete len:273 (-) Transcript_38841:2652-3470(-)